MSNTMVKTMTIDYKAAGYTHQFKYERQHPCYGWVEGSFYVVPDSYDLHLNALKSDKKVRNIQITEL